MDRTKELVPVTQIPEADGGTLIPEDSQTLERIPESPPIHTQDKLGEGEVTDESDVDDVEAQLTSKRDELGDGGQLLKVSEITYDDESPAGCSRSVDKRSFKSTFDVVIDMECFEDEDPEVSSQDRKQSYNDNLEIDEFPDEDNAVLLSAANIAEEPSELAEDLDEGNGLYEEVDAVSLALERDPQLKAQEEKCGVELKKFKKFKANDKIFPDVRFSDYNTIAFKVKPNYTPGDPLEPFPKTFVSKWDSKYVPMPCCHEHQHVMKRRKPNPQDNSDNNTEESNNRQSPPPKKISVWNRIRGALSDLPLLCSQDIANVMRIYCRMLPELKALNYCIEQVMVDDERTHFFSTVIPFMKSLVLELPEIVTCPIPILRKNVNHNISLNQKQAACLLANAFFCTFPRRFNIEIDLPSINFKELFADDGSEDDRKLIMKAHKIRCLINYFVRISTEMPTGVITYTRKILRHSNMPDWGKIDKGLSKFIPLIKGTIEDDGAGMLKVDFANRIIGGGVLGRGAVQEEILFVIYPELILSRLFTEKLNSNEAILITGCERFSTYLGYSYGFTYDGDYSDQTPYDSKGRRCTQIVAIDALYISRPSFQFHPKHITRELNKAYVGFSSASSTAVAVATGKWGCGAFNGDPQLKAVIQLLAASHAGRDMAYFTFGDIECYKNVTAIYDAIRDMKIKEIWNLLCQYHILCCSTTKQPRTLTEFCILYANGQKWQDEQSKQEPISVTESKSKKENLKLTQITDFYSVVKRPPPSFSLDDASVAAITNGIDKINSKKTQSRSSPTNVSSGKRQREESELQNLNEEQIQRIVQEENSETVTIDNIEERSSTEEKNTKNNVIVTPKSPKRAKRLEDFYPQTNDENE